ncbi:hypothetical protein FACS1894200_00860 [Spirochaetia bacterium]|nr:hypothetical protein FACS1894200_00860 [Spirochaetia bacterium]
MKKRLCFSILCSSLFLIACGSSAPVEENAPVVNNTPDVIVDETLTLPNTPRTVTPPEREPDIAPRSAFDDAITAAAAAIVAKLDPGSIVAVLNFSFADTDVAEDRIERLSGYVIDGIIDIIANSSKITVVERQSLEARMQELDFHYSGVVSDESAQSIANVLGAQYVSSGSLSNMGDTFMFQIKTIGVESTAVLASYRAEVSKTDSRIQTIIGTHIYKVGDVGPAHGIIFFDKGNFSNGWRYLEAAPVEAEFEATWGAYGKTVSGTGTTVGSGKRNTQVIVEQLDKLGESGNAAQMCASLSFDNYNDWFLPSRDELDLLYNNLKAKGLGDFEDSVYFSSSQYSSGKTAWVKVFKDGSQGNQYDGDHSFRVRPIRAF